MSDATVIMKDGSVRRFSDCQVGFVAGMLAITDNSGAATHLAADLVAEVQQIRASDRPIRKWFGVVDTETLHWIRSSGGTGCQIERDFPFQSGKFMFVATEEFEIVTCKKCLASAPAQALRARRVEA